jgi:hypothetical protein
MKENGQPTLHKGGEDLTPSLQKRMAHHNLQEPLQALPPMLNHIIAKAVREDLPRQGRDGDAGALPLETVAEVFKVGISPADTAVAEFEGGDVGAADNLVVCVHVATVAMSAGISDLMRCEDDGR